MRHDRGMDQQYETENEHDLLSDEDRDAGWEDDEAYGDWAQ